MTQDDGLVIFLVGLFLRQSVGLPGGQRVGLPFE
jgi:hypothetical protein